MPLQAEEEELRERARRKGRRGSISAECNPNESVPQADGNVEGLSVTPRKYPPSSPEERNLIRSWLSSHFLFSCISSLETWNEILSHMDKVECKEGEMIIEQGSMDANYLYIVNSGEFGVWVDGQLLPNTYAEPGSCFGELALMYQCPRQATVNCIKGPGSLWTIDRATFKQVLMKQGRHSGEKFLPTLRRNWVMRDCFSESELEKVADVMNEETIDKEGTVIIQQGDANVNRMKFYVLLHGTCIAKKNNVTVRSLGPGDYFGERSLLEMVPRTASVVTTSPNVVLASLDWTNFDRLLKKPCLRAFVRQIKTGYERCRFFFVVEDWRFPTNLTSLASKRFTSIEKFSRFMSGYTEDASNKSSVFWVVDESFATQVPWLTGRSFPNVESFVSFVNQGGPTGTTPFQNPSSRLAPTTSSSSSGGGEASNEDKRITIAKKRGRRGSVSGESSSPSADPSLIKRSNSSHLASDEALLGMLRRHFLFADLAAQELSFVAGQMVEQVFVRGDVVVVQDDPQADFFYLVKQGEFIVEKDGAKVDSVLYGPGSAFGELALMYFCPRQATVICNSEKGSLYALNREAFRSVLIGSRASFRDRQESFLKKSVPLFSTWRNEAIARIADVAEELTFKKEEIIIREGDDSFTSMKLYFVEAGHVDVRIGGEFIRTIGVGEYFGEKALLERIPRTATIAASSDVVKCIALDVPAFERLLGPLRTVLRGKSSSYIKKSSRPSQHNLSLSKNASEMNTKSVANGWFKVGQDVFRTSVPKLNGKTFRNVEEFHKSLASTLITGSTSDATEYSSYFVQGREYSTMIETLKGRTFQTLEEYFSSLSAPSSATDDDINNNTEMRMALRSTSSRSGVD